ncbi:hypothetical protein V6N13_049291 [Hibiscus sabdariffa]|uniref:Uncharacterized protein n=1 Tax=Hibiscus sabdariffa TaxID=183260 RepID=A0ABR2QXL7_9ROSI
MDKSGDVSRGTRKPQQHSSANLIVGKFTFTLKIPRLVAGKENQCPSHPQVQLSYPLISKSTTKRFKIPRKISDDCNVVDRASVPRKLRSGE